MQVASAYSVIPTVSSPFLPKKPQADRACVAVCLPVLLLREPPSGCVINLRKSSPEAPCVSLQNSNSLAAKLFYRQMRYQPNTYDICYSEEGANSPIVGLAYYGISTDRIIVLRKTLGGPPEKRDHNGIMNLAFNLGMTEPARLIPAAMCRKHSKQTANECLLTLPTT